MVTFRYRGPEARLMVFADELGMQPGTATVGACEDWCRRQIDLAEAGAGPGAVKGLLWSDAVAKGPFRFALDDVELLSTASE